MLSGALVASIALALAIASVHSDEPASRKFTVKIQDEKDVIADVEGNGGGVVDRTKRINLNSQGQGNFFLNITTMQNQPLHLSHYPNFMIDNRVVTANGNFKNLPLPKAAGGKVRTGHMHIWTTPENLQITQLVEIIPSKPKRAGDKRLMDTVLVAYLVENKSNQVHSFGARVLMDTYVVDNDGCLFAAPTHPGKILDGIVLKDKTLPPYVQMLQRPDLQNPGYAAHLTLNLGSRYEKVDKVVLSSLRVGFGNWDMPAAPAMGDSAICFSWPIKDLNPGAKRDMAYAYGGQSPAVPVGSEGRFQVALGGSFEPGKIFTVSATVADPTVGQALALELPAGIERLEGTEIQPVPPLTDDQEYSTVLWKGRVREPGKHTLRIRSSNGVTQSKTISITPQGK
jgi:hypothetical protein